jgi:energy-coupling factor transporter ATP-binding protein EcfA2
MDFGYRMQLMTQIVTVENLNFQYKRGAEPALRNINFSVEKGEFIGITGPAGAGKTTLLSCLNGIIPNYYGGNLEGRITVDGIEVAEASFLTLADHVGTVFEDPDFQMVSITVEEEVAFGPENLGVPPVEIEARIVAALDMVRIDHLRKRAISTLSGGQKQRVAIAAVLAMRPHVLLLDEPTSELDPIGTDEVFTALRQLNDELGITVIVISQNIERLAESADRVILMADGEVRLIGATREICLQREVLESTGMRVPHVVDLAMSLQAHLGTVLEPDTLPLTTAEGIPFLRSLLAERGVV